MDARSHHSAPREGNDMIRANDPELEMANASLPLIDVDRLRIGVYVVLDIGWRHHPFAFSSFTIRTTEQLIQLRTLGPRQVRYCPDRSSVRPLAEPVLDPPVLDQPVLDRAAVGAPAVNDSTADKAAAHLIKEAPAPAATPAVSAPRFSAGPAGALQRQQASLERVEDEYREIATSHQQLLKQLQTDPQAAAQTVARLAETMLATVADCPAPAVRLLSQRVGFVASGHEVGVSGLAMLLARESGFSRESIREVALAALLHDIGKVRIPAFLHEDDGRLTAFERRSYRQHVAFGVKLASGLDVSGTVIRAIAEHHERCDGGGFPAALRGDQMAPASRVLAIANRYLNLVCPLHFESGLTPYQALQQMYGAERAHFDPVYLPRFVRIMGVYPPGTLVELSDRRMAIVIASRPGASLSPRVQVVEMPEDERPSLAFDLDPGSSLRVRCSVLPGQLNSRWAQRSRQLARAAVYVEPLAAPGIEADQPTMRRTAV
jgi:putative nucleotidyltransferase with HDIG domain